MQTSKNSDRGRTRRRVKARTDRRLVIALAIASVLAVLVAAWALAFAAFEEQACHMQNSRACGSYPVVFAAFVVSRSIGLSSAIACVAVVLRRARNRG